MTSFAETIVAGGKVSVTMANRMLNDVKPETFARQPRLASGLVKTNHLAFIFGHLASYPAGWLQAAKLEVPPECVMPVGWSDLFPAGKECRDDPEGTIYPPMAEIVAFFNKSHETALAKLAGLSDARLSEPNPREGRLREMFPTLGGMLMFYMTSHMMLHIGQASTWRRCFGLGSVM
jgi:hypothetical protein